jgi:hypothetical protein
MILKIFLPKNLGIILAFYAQTTDSFCKNVIITLVFEKSGNFFAVNWQKSPKIAIITSTPESIIKTTVMVAWDRCYDFKIFSKKLAPFDWQQSEIMQKWAAKKCWFQKNLRSLTSFIVVSC